MTDNAHPILLFDGVCNLCNQSVQFVIKRDPQAIFRFAALQSETGNTLLQRHHLSTDELDTVVLVYQDKVFTRSNAALEVLRLMGRPWSFLTFFRILPQRLRDALYNFIAKNRYRWFGRQDHCMVPTPELKSRFLD